MAKKKDSERGGLIFVGCMFLGIGIGFLADALPAWTLIGMGTGFLAMWLVERN